MFSSLRAATLGFAGTLALVSVASAHEGWIADFDEAVKVAQAEKKDLFVDFTGSDWCGWCKKLNAEVFDHEEFLTAVKKDFVLVSLDFPRSDEVKAKVPNPKRNQELAEKYGIEGFPTILLVSVDGDVFGQTGYRPGGPEAYVTFVAELATKGKKEAGEAKALLSAWTAASAAEKGAAWDKLTAAFEAMGAESYSAKSLVEAVKAALEFDKDNAQGRRKRAVGALLKFGLGDEALIAAAREYDPKNAEGMFELALGAQFGSVQDDATAKAALKSLEEFDLACAFKDKAAGFRLHFLAARWCDGPLENPEGAKKFAAKAKEIGTDDKDALTAIDEILAK